MSLASQDSYVNTSQPYWAKVGSVGGSSFSTATISSLQASEIIVVNTDSFFISTQILEADEAYISSISTKGIYVDGALLTVVPGGGGNELLLNGIPIATTANLSSLSDWSLDPAISTLNLNANSTINGSLISSLTINAGNAFFTNIVANDISTATLTVFSTIHVISTISTLEIEANVAHFSSINGAQFPQGTVSSFETASISSATVSSLNGVQFPQTIPPQMVASTITGPDTFMSSSKNYLDATTANANIVAAGSLGGSINLRADPGYLGASGGAVNLQAFGGNGVGGAYGAIHLTAYEGTEAGTGNTSGGLIELVANSGGALSNATSAIKFSGGSVVSYAGAANPIGSLYGYNYLYGTVGVSLTASILPPTVNTPGTVYLYGDTGTVVGSDLYASRIYGYWNGLATPSNVFIAGRQTISGNSYVVLSNVSNIYMDSGAITGLDTINGSAYPPATPTPTDWANYAAVQNVNMNANVLSNASMLTGTEVSTLSGTILNMNVSSLNGNSYPPVVGNVADWANFPAITDVDMDTKNIINVSTVSGSEISTLSGTILNMNVSSLNGNSYPPAVDNVADWATFPAVQAVDMNGNNIENVETLNGTLVSTLSGNILNMNVSSLNGNSYPPAVDNVADWATFAAVQAVDMATHDINNAGVINGTSLNGTSINTSTGFVYAMDVSTLNTNISIDVTGKSITFVNNTGELAGVSSINAHDVNNPIVSSITFADLSLANSRGIIFVQNGLAIDLLGAVSTSPPAVINVSTINTPIDSLSANEFLLNAPGISTVNKQLNMHVSADEVSINANSIGPSYTPCQLDIKASNVSMSSITVSSINGISYPTLIPSGSLDSVVSVVLTSTFQEIGSCSATLYQASRMWATGTVILANLANAADYNVEVYLQVDGISSAVTSVTLPNRIDVGVPYDSSLTISQRTGVEAPGTYSAALYARTSTISGGDVTATHLDLFMMGNLG